MKKRQNRAGDLITQIDQGGIEKVALNDKPASSSDEFTDADSENLEAYGALDKEIDNHFSITQGEDSDAVLDYDPGDDVEREAMDGTATDIDTGGYTQGGMSSDATRAEFSGSRRMGGPTGGDVYGAGAASRQTKNTQDVAKGVDKPMSSKDNGLAQKIAGQNTLYRLNQPQK